MIFRVRLPSGATERVTLNSSEGLQQLGEKINQLDRLSGQFSLYSDPRFTVPFVFEKAKHGDMIFIRGTEIPTVTKNPPTKVPASSEDVDIENTAKEGKNDGGADGDGEDQLYRRRPGPRCRHGPRGMCEHCMPREDKRARVEAELKRLGKRGSSIAVLEALEALKFKISPQADPHAKAAAIDSVAAEAFQAYLAQTGFSQQRVGFCYGTKDNNDGTTNTFAIYEPPQCGNENAYALVDGDNAGDITSRASQVASFLGLDHVGIVISAKPRSTILSAMDVVFAASILAKMSEDQRKAFIVFVVTTTETGETLFEAFQVSDLAVEMFEADAFEPIESQKPNGGRILCKQDVLVEGKDTRKVPTEFFLLNVPIKSCDSWLRTTFTIENRDISPQAPSQLRAIMDDDSLPLHKRLADFHLLLFLSNIFDIKSDMPGLCASIKQGEDIEDGYRLMIDNMASAG